AANCPADTVRPSSFQCSNPLCTTTTGGSSAVPAGFCNGTSAGACPAVASQACSGVCNAGNTACAGGCAGDTDCPSGSYCGAGACLPKKGNSSGCNAGG